MSPSSPTTPDSPSAPGRPRAELLRSRLCAWYVEHRRDLPWRHTRDPYAIWISEAMLQQTRVETVIPYYRRFLERLPSVEALAAASDDDVMALWSGLGYYRRARALVKAAQVLVAQHGGRFPRTRAEMLALPGIGPYTAGAVLSIAFDQSEPLVDGNVVRVLARLFGLRAPRGSGELNRRLDELTAELVPPTPDEADETRAPVRPRIWNQALMELGATVCSVRAPACLICPLSDVCVAGRSGNPEELPVAPTRKAEVLDVELEVFVLLRRGRVLLHQRADDGLMAGLWELPTREVVPSGGRARLWAQRLPAGGPRIRRGVELGLVTHGITKHRIRARVHRASVHSKEAERGQERSGRRWRWVRPADVDALGVTGMTRKALRRFLTAGGVERPSTGT